MLVNFKVHSLLSLVLFMQLVSTNKYSFNKKIDKYFEDGVISEEHWNDIHEYIKKHGNIMSIYELQSIESINLDILKTIARLSRDDQHIEYELLTTKEDNKHTKITLRYDAPQFKLERVRLCRLPENIINCKLPQSLDDKLFLRIRYKTRHLDCGIAGQKNKFESYAFDKVALFESTHRYLFNTYSFHFQLSDIGILKNLTVGDFKIGYGQGVVFNSSFSLTNKTLDLLDIIKVCHNGVKPHTSCFKNNLRGIAVTVGNYNFQMLCFGAYNFLDGNIKSNKITSAYRGGYYKTKHDLAKKDKINETVFGGTLFYKRNSNFEVGLNAVYTMFSNKFSGYRKAYSFSEQSNYNVGPFARCSVGPVHYFIEYAISKGWGGAINTGAIINIIKQLDLFLLFREYSERYYNFYGKAFKENSSTNCSGISECGNNEIGLYVGTIIKPVNQYTFTLTVDTFAIPEITAKKQPYCGCEGLIKCEYNFSKLRSILLQLKRKCKYDYSNKAVGNKISDQYRMKIVFNNNLKRIDINGQLHAMFNNNSGDTLLLAICALVKVNIKLKSYILSPYVLCGFADGENRLSIFEPNVLYKNSIMTQLTCPLLKTGIVLGYKFSFNVRLECRYNFQWNFFENEKYINNINIQIISET